MSLARGMARVASVFVEADDFQVAVKTDLACYLGSYTIDGTATGSERAELMAARILLFDPTYQMPEGSQVVIDGERWQLARGGVSYQRRPWANELPVYGRAHVLRVV